MIFSCFAFINVCLWHLGQNKGKFFNSVSSRICTLVLLPQIGHSINFSFALGIFPPTHKRKIALAIVAKESRKSLLHFCWVFDTICERKRCVCFNPNLRIIRSEADYGVHRIVCSVKCNLVISLAVIPRASLDFFRVDLNAFYEIQQLIEAFTVCNSRISIGSLYCGISCGLRSYCGNACNSILAVAYCGRLGIRHIAITTIKITAPKPANPIIFSCLIS